MYDIHDYDYKVNMNQERVDELKECVHEFFTKYLNHVEESDSGREFNPVTIGCCRAFMLEPLNGLLDRMRELSGAKPNPLERPDSTTNFVEPKAPLQPQQQCVHSRFDLEQHIMNAWQVVDDLKLLSETHCNRPMTDDEIQNFLLGLITIYQLRFEAVMDTFEQLIAQRKL